MSRRPVVNVGELVEARESVREPRYRARLFPIGSTLGLGKLGCNLTEIAPGSRSFPYHFHHANEEMFFVLEGEGTLRWPGGETPLRPGDVVGCVAGAAGAHQIFNPGKVPLRYLALSTLVDPEIVEYPDSGKFGATAGRPPGAPGSAARFRHIGFAKDGVDYWAGEE
jgi:uncharacterized cupin superfamily protein